MWNAIVDGTMPGFWPARPSRFWSTTLAPFRRWYLRSYYRIASVEVQSREDPWRRIGPEDGVLIAPNHSHDSDPHVMMELGRRWRRRLHFMAAWQLFRGHAGLDGWVLQRLGAFSVDREGCDRRAVKQAVGLLTSGSSLVVFPEGEVYRLNDRLTPLLEGVPFMAINAQRDLAQASSSARVWIVPAAIRYKYTHDVSASLSQAMDKLEARLLTKAPHGMRLDERIIRFGEILLTLKEKEKLGQSRELAGDLPDRVRHLVETLLQKLETTWLKKSPAAETVPLRIKAIRRRLLEVWTEEPADVELRRQAGEGLDDVQLVLQLYSYPGNYIREQPSLERMAETVEKFEEDVTGFARPKGQRRARVVLGEPIDLSQYDGSLRARLVATQVTDRLEEAITELMRVEA